MSDAIKLRTCAKCGENAMSIMVNTVGIYPKFYSECRYCGYRGPDCDTLEMAVANHNLHPVEDRLRAEIETLRDTIRDNEAYFMEQKNAYAVLMANARMERARAERAEATLHEIGAILDDFEGMTPDFATYHLLIYRVRDRSALLRGE